MNKIRVWTGMKIFPEADYEIEEEINIGQIVKIPMRKKEILAVVIKKITESQFSLKLAAKTEFSFSESYIKFINQSSMTTLNNFQSILSTNIKMFSERVKDKTMEIGNYLGSIFSEEQTAVLKTIKGNPSGIFLLWGITGSGKTEVFFELIAEKIKNNEQVLVILPEIAITESITNRFFDKFGFYPTIWNSKCKNKTNFTNIHDGNIAVVIGSRCSIFLSFKNLGLIVVDEEHDSSFKQTTAPIYNCRDLAVIRGLVEKIPVILASATPSLESFYNCQNGKYHLLKLTKRYKNILMPKVNFKISPNTKEFLSPYTLEKIQTEVNKDKQIMIFLNRRGFSSIVICKACFNRLHCLNCENTLNFHSFKKLLLCHQCGKKYDFENCFVCDSSGTLTSYGFGVEKIHEYLLKKFPETKIDIISSDTCDSKEKIQEFISKMNNKEVQIIVGTQILAKGHNFPDISLVVILGSHNSFFNFRSNEAVFQTLIQVAGRAGRSYDINENNGEISNAEVILETEKVINSQMKTFFENHDYEGFIKSEMESRKNWNLTPFCRVILFKVINKSEKVCQKILMDLKKELQIFNFISISDPLLIKKYKDQFFYQLISRINREDFVKNNKKIRLIIPNTCTVDIDPINLNQ